MGVQRHESVGCWVADRNRGNDADHCHRLCLSHLQTSLLWIEQPRHRPLQPQPCQPGCGTQPNNSSRSPGPPFNFGPAFAELICSTCVPRCCWSRKQLSEVLIYVLQKKTIKKKLTKKKKKKKKK